MLAQFFEVVKKCVVRGKIGYDSLCAELSQRIMIPFVAYADERQVHLAGGGYVPDGIADVDDVGDFVCHAGQFNCFGEDFGAGEFVVGKTGVGRIGRKPDVGKLDGSGAAPAARGNAGNVVIIGFEAPPEGGGTGNFAEIGGLFRPRHPERLQIMLFEGKSFGFGRVVAEMIIKGGTENYVIRYLREFCPVDGREWPPENGSVTIGKALAVNFIGIQQGAIDIEEDEGFQEWLVYVFLQIVIWITVSPFCQL